MPAEFRDVYKRQSYYSLTDDIKKEIGPHTIYFTFEFEGQPYYFYRSTDDPKSVYRIDKERHFITKLTLDEFRRFLFQEYKIGLPALTFSEITERFFRIYGRENTLEDVYKRQALRSRNHAPHCYYLNLSAVSYFICTLGSQ